VRQSWEEEKSDDSFEHTGDTEMAIVLARPNDGDISLEVEEQESIKKQKMDSENEQAGLLSQSRPEK
jgi:Ethanolamine utilization protein EutJ (predicted chaperonin)